MNITRRSVFAMPAAALLRADNWTTKEVRRWPAPEANQAVAVDAHHFYAIGNHAIGKYDKTTGKRISGWECSKGKPLIHLNSGVVQAGVLYCAHSNYPGQPMVSSIEMWNVADMRHSATHSFGIYGGSLTWIDFYRTRRYITFGHYGNKAGEPGHDARWTSLVQVDEDWQRRKAWVYPPELVSKLGDYTISGGTFGPDGRLYCTGHDNAEIYVLTFPTGGSVLQLEATFPAPNHGQGIAWDRHQPWTMYSIDRARKEVIVSKVWRA